MTSEKRRNLRLYMTVAKAPPLLRAAVQFQDDQQPLQQKEKARQGTQDLREGEARGFQTSTPNVTAGKSTLWTNTGQD